MLSIHLLINIFLYFLSIQKYRANGEPPEEVPNIDEFDKLLENDNNDNNDDDDERFGAITPRMSPPPAKVAAKKRPVRPSPMKFKIIQVIYLIKANKQKQK